ncbi:MAG: hypothetical protein WCL14_11005, partial [Bacteroidota bacterium]
SKQPAAITSPDSSGSPLLCVGNGDAAATADSGTKMGRDVNIGSKKENLLTYPSIAEKLGGIVTRGPCLP